MIQTVHQLRKRWKPTKERLAAERDDHPTSIRLHRAFSWLQRCEKCSADEDPDLALICQWIAFNALYGQWDEGRREPRPDRECWRRFVDRLLAIDTSGHISQTLIAHRELVMATLEDEYLSSFFWEEPSEIRASKSRKAKFDARTWYVDKKWSLLMDRLLERIYLLRCQLVHGAATYQGRLNRASLLRCVELLGVLMSGMLLAVIDHGAGEDWGAMCYPPLRDAR